MRCAAASAAASRSTRSASTRSSPTSSPRCSPALSASTSTAANTSRRPVPPSIVANRGFGFVEPAALGIAVRRATGAPLAHRRRAVGAGRSARSRAASARSARARPTCARALRAGHLVGVPLAPTWLRTGAGMPPRPLMQAMTHAPIVPVAVTPGGPFGAGDRRLAGAFRPAGDARRPLRPRRPARRGALRRRDARRGAQRLLEAKLSGHRYARAMPEIVTDDGIKIAYSTWGRARRLAGRA